MTMLEALQRLYPERAEVILAGCHKAGVFKECDKKRAEFEAARDLKRYRKLEKGTT